MKTFTLIAELSFCPAAKSPLTQVSNYSVTCCIQLPESKIRGEKKKRKSWQAALGHHEPTKKDSISCLLKRFICLLLSPSMSPHVRHWKQFPAEQIFHTKGRSSMCNKDGWLLNRDSSPSHNHKKFLSRTHPTHRTARSPSESIRNDEETDYLKPFCRHGDAFSGFATACALIKNSFECQELRRIIYESADSWWHSEIFFSQNNRSFFIMFLLSLKVFTSTFWVVWTEWYFPFMSSKVVLGELHDIILLSTHVLTW